MRNFYLWLSCIFYGVLFFMLLPQSIHIFEADAVAYIQEARQYASGNFTIALNGCWSPLHSWLLIPFIKYGVDPFLACRIINGVSGLICIPLFYRITSFFISSSAIRNILVVFSSLLFISMAFHRTGADTLQLAILIIYINLIYDFESSRKNRFLILATLAGAMAYYAKSYNLYFFILHITIVIFLVSKNLTFKSFLSEWKRMVIVFCSLLLFIGPYVAMISVKYHKFTVSTAGPITMNKSLEPSFTDGPKFFVPPRGANALAIADDPTFFQKSYITPLTSKHYLAKEVKVIIINILEYFKLLNQVSIFSIGILSVFGYLIFSEKKELNRKNLLIIITTLVYPIGYMMIAVEWRYIWIVSVLLVMMSGIIFEKLLRLSSLSSFKLKIGFCFIVASFAILPSLEIKDLFNENDYEEMAIALREKGITGNFIATSDNWKNTSRNYVIAYLNNSKYFGLFSEDYTSEIIFKGAKEYDIAYFLIHYKTLGEKQQLLQSDVAKQSAIVFPDIYPGVIVCKLFQNKN